MERKDVLLAELQKLTLLIQALSNKLPQGNFENQTDLEQYTGLFKKETGIDLTDLIQLNNGQELAVFMDKFAKNDHSNQRLFTQLLQEISNKTADTHPNLSALLAQKEAEITAHFEQKSKTTSWWNY